MMPDNWVELNQAGKDQYGDLFPIGIVPVRSILPYEARLGNLPGHYRIYLVEWKALEPGQQDALLARVLARNPGAALQDIKAQVERDGWMPMRAELVEMAGSSRIGLFL